MKTTRDGHPFVVIGENIHATRIVLRSGKRVVATPDGREALVFAAADGSARQLVIPDAVRASSSFGEGKVKHVRAALVAALSGSDRDAEAGREYLAWLAARQVAAGADYLDLNVDEISERPEDQRTAMAWLVGAIEAVSPVPLALDSSNTEIIRAGLEARDTSRPAPLLNSASLERLDVLDLAAEHGCPVVVTAAGGTDLPVERRGARGERDADGRGRGAPAGSRSIGSTSTRSSCRSPSIRRSAAMSSTRSPGCGPTSGRPSTSPAASPTSRTGCRSGSSSTTSSSTSRPRPAPTAGSSIRWRATWTSSSPRTGRPGRTGWPRTSCAGAIPTA